MIVFMRTKIYFFIFITENFTLKFYFKFYFRLVNFFIFFFSTKTILQVVKPYICVTFYFKKKSKKKKFSNLRATRVLDTFPLYVVFSKATFTSSRFNTSLITFIMLVLSREIRIRDEFDCTFRSD